MSVRGPIITLSAVAAFGIGLLAVNIAADPGRQPPATPVAVTEVVETAPTAVPTVPPDVTTTIAPPPVTQAPSTPYGGYSSGY